MLKSRMVGFVLSTMVLFLLTGCFSTKKMMTKGNFETAKGWESAAIVQVNITPPELPVIPLIDAGAYRSKFHKVADKAMNVHESKIDAVSEALATLLAEKSGLQVKGGKKLYLSDEYGALEANGVEFYENRLMNEDFPKNVIPTGCNNILDFGEIDNSWAFLAKDANISKVKENVSKTCESLGVDGLIVADVMVPTLGASAFGIKGTRILKIYLYYIDKSGTVISKAMAHSEIVGSKPDDIDTYAMVFEKFKPLCTELLSTVYGQNSPAAN